MCRLHDISVKSKKNYLLKSIKKKLSTKKGHALQFLGGYNLIPKLLSV